MYHSSLVANKILCKGFTVKRDITPMQLQKILYLVAIQHKRATGEDLLNEYFMIWETGPVIPSIFRQFEAFGKKPIRKYAKDSFGEGEVIRTSALDHVINIVLAATQGLTGAELAQTLRGENSAWFNAYGKGQKHISPEDLATDESFLRLIGHTQ